MRGRDDPRNSFRRKQFKHRLLEFDQKMHGPKHARYETNDREQNPSTPPQLMPSNNAQPANR